MSEIKSLRKWNLLMGGLHLFQAALMVVLILFVTEDNPELSLIIRTWGQFGIEQTDLITGIPVIYGSVIFLGMSSIAHFFISTIWYKKYQAGLEKGINKARWWEYSFSSSVMIVIIAMLGGIIEFAPLVFLFTLNFLMNMFGLVMEIHNQTTEKTRWISYNLGMLAGFIPWIVIGVYFGFAIENNPDSIPNWAYVGFVVLFVFYNTFAINMYLQYKKKGPWKNYIFGEKMYVLLSLISKSALAWTVYVGITVSA